MSSSRAQGPARLRFRTGNSQITTVVFNQNDTSSRSSVPNWRWMLRQGLDASTSYTRSSDLLTSRLATTVSISRTCGTGPNFGKVYTASGSGFPFENLVTDPSAYSPANFAVPTSAENAAKTAFASKIRQYDSKWQSGSFAGEIGKTIKSLRHPLEGLRKGIGSYLDQAKKLARRPLNYSRYSRAYGQVLRNRQREAIGRALSSTYLEWKFGMNPIIYDMVDAQKAYYHLTSKTHADISRVAAGANWEFNISLGKFPGGSIVDVIGPHPISGETQYGYCKTEKSYRVSGRVNYSGAISADLVVGGALPALQLLPRDFIPTVWQLLPWSWAIDYFANVGDMLDVLSTSFGSLVWCNRSTYVAIDQTFSSQLFASGNGLLWTGSPTMSGGTAKALYTSRRYSRARFNPNTLNMVPSLMFRSPSFNQGINLGAVLHQGRAVEELLSRRYN